MGIPPNDKMYDGIPVKFRIHNPAKFEEVSLRSVVSADMPSWLMIESEQHYRKIPLDVLPVDNS